MKKSFLLIVLVLLAVPGIWAQERGLLIIANENLGQVKVGKQYALFIAVDSYRSWPALRKPVADAKEIRDILKKEYYIDEVIELYNQDATKQNIIKTFTDLQGKLDTHDSLFIYYAGHGHLDGASNTGFWIPVDGGTNRNSQENWLPNSQIRGYISRFKSIHIFMVSDACFSGDILNTNRSAMPQIDNAFYRRAYTLASRQVLTSGSSETVPDQSEFSEALKICLRKNTAALIDPHEIYIDVRLSVRSSTPLYGTLNSANHQDGATFLFFRRQGLPNTSSDRDKPPPDRPSPDKVSPPPVRVESPPPPDNPPPPKKFYNEKYFRVGGLFSFNNAAGNNTAGNNAADANNGDLRVGIEPYIYFDGYAGNIKLSIQLGHLSDINTGDTAKYYNDRDISPVRDFLYLKFTSSFWITPWLGLGLELMPVFYLTNNYDFFYEYGGHYNGGSDIGPTFIFNPIISFHPFYGWYFRLGTDNMGIADGANYDTKYQYGLWIEDLYFTAKVGIIENADFWLSSYFFISTNDYQIDSYFRKIRFGMNFYFIEGIIFGFNVDFPIGTEVNRTTMEYQGISLIPSIQASFGRIGVKTNLYVYGIGADKRKVSITPEIDIFFWF